MLLEDDNDFLRAFAAYPWGRCLGSAKSCIMSRVEQVSTNGDRERERGRECVHVCVTALHQFVYLLDSIIINE